MKFKGCKPPHTLTFNDKKHRPTYWGSECGRFGIVNIMWKNYGYVQVLWWPKKPTKKELAQRERAREKREKLAKARARAAGYTYYRTSSGRSLKYLQVKPWFVYYKDETITAMLIVNELMRELEPLPDRARVKDVRSVVQAVARRHGGYKGLKGTTLRAVDRYEA